MDAIPVQIEKNTNDWIKSCFKSFNSQRVGWETGKDASTAIFARPHLDGSKWSKKMEEALVAVVARLAMAPWLLDAFLQSKTPGF